jgi:hypothetical protein
LLATQHDQFAERGQTLLQSLGDLAVLAGDEDF